MPSPFAGSSATYPTTYLIPSDGDDIDAASVNVAFEALGDRTEWLRARQNDYFQYTNSTNSGGDPSTVETFTYAVIAGAWTKSAVVKVDVPSCVAFDQLQCRLHALFIISATSAYASLLSYRMYATDDVSGTPSDSVVLGSHSAIGADDGTNGADKYWPVSPHGRHTVSFNGTTRIGLEIRIRNSAAGSQLAILSGIHLEVQRIKF
jgi:hypothetical protein